MKRQAGFKLSVPEVLDTFANYGLPIYMCIDRPLLEITFKPSEDQSLDERIKKVIQAIIIHLPNAYSFFENIDIIYPGDLSEDDTALYAAVIIALFEEGYMSESLHEVIEWLEDKSFTNCHIPICKTMITGGICLSTIDHHERIFGSSGLYIAIKKTNITFHDRSLSAEAAGLITTALIKDKMPLLQSALQSFQDLSPLHHEEFIGQIFDVDHDRSIAFISMLDPSFIENDEWIGSINQLGVQIC